jgi:hypothetical protein
VAPPDVPVHREEVAERQAQAVQPSQLVHCPH